MWHKRILTRARAAGVSALERSPALYCRVMRRRHQLPFLDAATEIVIDGYPCSANSFARLAFLHANPGARVATHTHRWPHLALAVRRGIPAVVLIREPVDAVASHVVRMGADPAAEFAHYERFYRSLLPLVDHVVVAPFDVVTSRFGTVIDRVNQQFATGFVPFDHDDATAVAAVFDEMDAPTRWRQQTGDETGAHDWQWKVAHPSPERHERTAGVKELISSTPFSERRERCQELYDRMVSTAAVG